MQIEQKRWKDAELSVEKVKLWLLNNLPNYVTSLKTTDDIKEFVAEVGIHKVFLFSGAKKTPQLYQALSSQYHNLLRFAIVNNDAPEAAKMAELMEVENIPTICILESFVGASDFTTMVRYYEGDLKSLPSISNWVDRFALKEEKEKAEKFIEVKSKEAVNRKEKKSGYQFADDMSTINEKVIASHKAGLVLFTEKDHPDSIHYIDMITAFAPHVSEYMNVIIYAVKKGSTDPAVRKEINPKNLPIFKYYRNGMVDQ